MKRRLIPLLGALLALAPLCSLQAQEKKRLKLTLEEAQICAVENNRTLKNASLDVQKSQATRWKALASMLPQVNAQADYSDFLGYKLNLGGMSIPMNPSGTLAVTASITLSGAQVVATQISQIAAKMSDITQRQSEQQIKDQVRTLYYSALVMDETVRLLEENLNNLQSLYAYTEASVKAGISEQTDADQLLVQLASMQTSISSSRRSMEMVYNSLLLQLGLDIDTEIVLTQSLDDLLNTQTAAELLSREFNLDNNYNWQLMQESLKLSKKQVRSAQWSYGPTISAFYQYSAKTYFGKSEGFNTTPPNMVGASVSLPIFSSLSRLKAVKEAKIDYEKQLNSLADTENALKVQHRQLCYNLNTAFETFNTQKQNIDVTQRVFKNISNKYEVGAASSLDLTNAGTNLIAAQSSYVQALMELVNAQIALEELLNE
ncbi:MAG: TolC family protein [Bacteroidales bacterium]|nr:TolC family protein [Bacteroidales bacterium]